MTKFVIQSVNIGDEEVQEIIVDTTPQEDEFYADIRELIAKLPESEDVTIFVLRAHLVIEQLVIRMTESLVRNPQHIRKANRLQFSTRVLFLRSLVKPLIQSDDSFWGSINLLNGLRNDLAHKLDIPALEKDIDSFIELAASTLQMSSRPGFDSLVRIDKLKACLKGLCEFTSGVLAVTWQERQSGA
ncbi:hypothetical protein [Arenicella xantha]|uniref:Uncharacterized protein n=1 Tax=Arenicella xantha TaxID=644221 RepID=A0A395JSY9_9GAMM|nr:hypothetical protein [Arenicella xantha]RBP53586.1 hypothetical protein DFR28_101973 [Arenicella xantha]